MSEQNKLGFHAADYKDWLKALKIRVRQVQLKAAVAVNRELLSFYWDGDRLEMQQRRRGSLHCAEHHRLWLEPQCLDPSNRRWSLNDED